MTNATTAPLEKAPPSTPPLVTPIVPPPSTTQSTVTSTTLTSSVESSTSAAPSTTVTSTSHVTGSSSSDSLSSSRAVVAEPLPPLARRANINNVTSSAQLPVPQTPPPALTPPPTSPVAHPPRPPSSLSSPPNASNAHLALLPSSTARTSGLPVALLWLPYVALTLFLTALLVASFVHFHCKNGHKYKKRRTTTPTSAPSTSWRDPIIENAIQHVALGGSVPPPVGDTDRQQSTSGLTTTTMTSIIRHHHPQQQQQLSVNSWAAAATATGGGILVQPSDAQDRNRKCNGKTSSGRARDGRYSVEFVTNRNGSMVNMRGCGGASDVTGIGDKKAEPNHRHADVTSRVTRNNSRVVMTTTAVAGRRAGGAGRSAMAMARVAPVSTSTVVSRARVPDQDWPTGSLYSAVRICKMDETAEDWNRLLGHSRL